MTDEDRLLILNKINEVNCKLFNISNKLSDIENTLNEINSDYDEQSSGLDDGYVFPKNRIIKAKFAGSAGKFIKIPNMIVLHSGVKNIGVAEWFKNPRNKDGKYRKCWTHFAYSEKINLIAQCDSLINRGQHVGPFWNDCSYGIEFPGPYDKDPRSNHERDECLYTIDEILNYNPFVQFLTCHKFISVGNRDPGVGVKKEWFDGLGFTVLWSKDEALEYKKNYFKHYAKN